MKWIFFIMILSPILALGQWDPPTQGPDDHRPIPPAEPESLNLPDKIANGGNFSAYFVSKPIGFQVKNLGHVPATIMIVTEIDDEKQIVSYPLASNEVRHFQPEPMLGRQDTVSIYVLSLQNFALTTENYVKVRGRLAKSIQIQTPVEPQTHLRRVTTQSGKAVTVAVDGQNQVHFPIYGQVIGSWNVTERTVHLDEGSILPSAEID